MVNLIIRANVSIGIFNPNIGLEWPYQVTPYRSLIPGMAGPGMDISGGDLPSKLYFINSRADTSTGGTDPRGPNCYAGTVRYCHQADQGAGFHKFVMPIVSGYAYQGRAVNSALGRGNYDYVGQAAPGPGLVIRCCRLTFAGGLHTHAWHLASWCGDEAAAPGVSNFTSDQRDCLNGSLSGEDTEDLTYTNCEVRFGMDEQAQIGYYKTDRMSWLRGACYDPLHAPPGFGMPPGSHHEEGKDHGYGMLIGGTRFPVPNPPTDPDPIPTDFTDHVLVAQSVFAHTTDRNPTLCALNTAIVNNLHYNHGRPEIGRGAALNVLDNQGIMTKAGKQMHVNLVGSITVLGPNQQNTQTQLPVLAVIASISPGSTGHLAYNAQFGWVPVSSQGDFFYDDPVGYLQPNLIASAWPTGLGSNYSGVLRPFANPLAPTVPQGLAFVDLMERTVGMKPSKRHLIPGGGLNRVFNQIRDRLNGIPGSNEFINAVSEIGGWPAIPQMTVDPANPGSEYWAPMPLDATRDDIVPNGGTFLDGSSSDGYSKLRRWIINQHFWSTTHAPV